MLTLLNNRYQTIQVLSSGGFGETFLAEDTYMPSRRRCVIKQLKPAINNPQMHQLLQQRFQQERFQREAAILETLGEGSEQIPKLFAYFSENGQFYLVQEWIQGETLAAKLEASKVLAEDIVRDILASLLSVLEYVHGEGIIHRDIKPDNIILRSSNGKPVLIDFGAVKETLATLVNAQGKTTHSIVVGTPGFMAPEQAAGRPIYASDLYSLGLTAIYLLTGKQPQELATDPQTGELIWHEYPLNISPSLASVIDKAIQYHPRDRYTTARKMLDALQAVTAVYTPQPTTQATVVLSPASSKAINYSDLASLPQPAPAIAYAVTQKNLPKSLLWGGLLAASLIGAATLFNFSQNQPPQSAIINSPPQSTPVATQSPPDLEVENVPSTPIATSPTPANVLPTPIAKPSPTPANVPLTVPQPASSELATPVQQPTSTSVEPPQPINKDKIAVSAPQQENQRNSSGSQSSVPGFPTGTSEDAVKATLGNPTKTSKGYFPNTRAVLYELKPKQVTLGYIFDRNSGRLRQTEVSFAQGVEPAVMQATLQKMLGDRALINVSQGLQKVYDRRANNYSFNVGELEGVIERNQGDRIYIGVWDADLH